MISSFEVRVWVSGFGFWVLGSGFRFWLAHSFGLDRKRKRNGTAHRTTLARRAEAERKASLSVFVLRCCTKPAEIVCGGFKVAEWLTGSLGPSGGSGSLIAFVYGPDWEDVAGFIVVRVASCFAFSRVRFVRSPSLTSLVCLASAGPQDPTWTPTRRGLSSGAFPCPVSLRLHLVSVT